MPVASTYALGKAALQSKCAQEENQNHPGYVLADGVRVYRPLTFRENLAARVEDFNTLKDTRGKKRTLQDRLHLFDTSLNSCSSVAYKAGSTLFTIISQDQELLTLPRNFTMPSLRTEYPTHDVSLDSTKGKYNCGLTESDILVHDAWLMAVEGDRVLLREAASITFSLLNQRHTLVNGMGFYVHKSLTLNDEKKALFIGNLYGNSDAVGSYDLDSSRSFLRVAPSPRGRKR